MKKLLVVFGTMLVVAATTITAVAGYSLLDAGEYVEVISVNPAWTTLHTPIDGCVELSRQSDHTSNSGVRRSVPIAGALIGSLENRHGSKDDAPHALENSPELAQAAPMGPEGCYETRQVKSGYEVTYRFNGEVHIVDMDFDPGRRLPVVEGQVVTYFDG